eukprot:4210028-Amphidinium_carterae.1
MPLMLPVATEVGMPTYIKGAQPDARVPHRLSQSMMTSLASALFAWSTHQVNLLHVDIQESFVRHARQGKFYNKLLLAFGECTLVLVSNAQSMACHLETRLQ